MDPKALWRVGAKVELAVVLVVVAVVLAVAALVAVGVLVVVLVLLVRVVAARVQLDPASAENLCILKNIHTRTECCHDWRRRYREGRHR